MSDAFRVVVVGDVGTDILAQLSGPLAVGSDAAGTVTVMGGGAGANVAAWLAHLGVEVVLVGRVGDDVAGRLRTAELTAAGVVTVLAVDAERPTGTVIVLVDPDGERTMVPDRGANRGLRPADLPPELLGGGGHLHLSAYPLLDPVSAPAARDALRAARAAGLTVSVDPSSTGPLRAYGVARFRAEVAGVDLLLPNAAEALLLTGASNVPDAAQALAADHATVVVSCGAQGAVWSAGGRHGAVPAVPGPVLDTTGAGDAFSAGVLRARLSGAGVADSAAAGVAVAATAVALRGARPGA